ncbi:molybdate ABC transporter substrate-binding protein [Brevundimonas sp. LM2]|uniref:molybdate ABC transporter substrate-binding protein n=1 Tax=Brevundimonas sp. LM2 TaxID=1938605 RepID=UPI000983EA21|nr:molybdate ABC transporter substrate-binding protein [Brevundimonas sp. LM2]AQR63485.1 molybdate ABC transporter substrate-binding protein [Brevundimonas sp. LM2]
MNRHALTAAFVGLALVVLAACAPAAPGRDRTVTVFAAASLTDALTEIAADYEREAGTAVVLSFGATGGLARQVQAGAPADVIILADPAWMDRLQAAERLGAEPVDLLRNDLVVIAPKGTDGEGDPFAALGGGDRLAIGDPESVPAGAYARAWLQRSGRWDAVKDRLVFGADVRAVRAFVARGEAALGVVYRSDAVGRTDVRIVLAPPAAEQPIILYPAAKGVDGGPEATAFLAHLSSPMAAAVFRRRGFEPVG